MTSAQYIYLSARDADRCIYRIVSCDRFLKMLRDRQNCLVLPLLWDDPFENFILNGTAVTPDGKHVKFAFRDQLYGQCWSLHRETDLMWRGYSPNKDAVKLKTTIRALYGSLYEQGGPYRDASCFIGKVRYLLKKRIADVLRRVIIPDPSGVAVGATLLVKRWAFRSESEVRLIYLRQRRARSRHPLSRPRKAFCYKLDPNAVFMEAVLDPRMRDAEAKKWKQRFQNAGFKNRIIQSGLYKPPGRIVINLP